jgi:predicted PurR-regulated permease PerM
VDRLLSKKWILILISIILLLVALYLILLIKPIIHYVWILIKGVLAPFFVAMIISYVLNPIVNRLSKRRVPRTAAVLLIYLVFVAAVTVILMNLIPMFLKQVQELNEHLPEMTVKAQGWYEDVNNHKWLPDSVRDGINKALSELEKDIASLIGGMAGGIGTTIDVLFAAFIVPFLVFYMLKDFQMLERTALAVVPKEHRKATVKMLVDIDEALGNYVRGQFIVCMIVGGLAYLGYWLIGMPYSLLLASIVAIFNVIPYLGPFFGAAPAIIMASTVSFKMVLLVAGVNLVVQVLEGNVISPQVVGRKLHMHPLLIILVLLIGGELAGIIGLILAVPTYAVLKVVIDHLLVYRQNRRDPTVNDV